jgi:hypothetical protein
VDNIKPKWVTCLWLSFFGLIAVLYLLVFAVPDAIIAGPVQDINCPNPSSPPNPYMCNPFNLNDALPTIVVQKTGMKAKNQFLLVDLMPSRNLGTNRANVKETFVIDYSLEMYSLKEDLSIDKQLLIRPHSAEYNCWGSTDDKCEVKNFLLIPEIEHENYLILMRVTTA